LTEGEESRCILVIDDDITCLDIVSFLFEERGFQVKRCSGGEQAIEMLRDLSVELVLVDLMMPGLNGVETVKQIRNQGMKDLPIIAFSASEDLELLKQASVAGCDKILRKPLRADKLLAEIEGLLR